MNTLCALLLCLAALIHPKNLMTEQKELRAGSWGGEHLRLDVTDDGATLEFDCATGGFDRLPKPDVRGRFTVGGTYEAEHGGPVRADEKTNPLKVEYVGVLKNDKLRLSVRRVGAKRAFAVFHVVHGQESMLFKCR